MIGYLGSKRRLLLRILAIVRELPEVRHVMDVFSGSARVGHALKRAGYYVTSNDHNRYAAVIAGCYIQADRRLVWNEVARCLRELSALPPLEGYFTETYSRRAPFFHPKNATRIDAMREAISSMSLTRDVENVVLTSLIEAAHRVSACTGKHVSYLKDWGPHTLKDIVLRMPDVLPGPGTALQMDALDAARQTEVDFAYLDPPYTHLKYLHYYHIWETLVRWDKPEVYGKCCRRMDCKSYSSDFNSKDRAHAALGELVDALRTHHVLVSFNNEGYISREEMESLLSRKGSVLVAEINHKRYMSAYISYNRYMDALTGKCGPDNMQTSPPQSFGPVEYLYFVSDDPDAIHRVEKAMQSNHMRIPNLLPS